MQHRKMLKYGNNLKTHEEYNEKFQRTTYTSCGGREQRLWIKFNIWKQQLSRMGKRMNFILNNLKAKT